MSEEQQKVPFYKKSWFIILALIFFFPVGLYLMWAHTNWNKAAKWIITAVIALIAVSTLFTEDDTSDTNETQVATEETQTEEAPAEEEPEAVEEEPVEEEPAEEPAEEPEEEVETESGEQEASASEDEEVVEEEEAEEIVGIGETLTVDDIDFTVNDMYQQDSVGDVIASNANDTYLILDVSVTNNQNEAVMLMDSYFKIVDGETVFEPDGTASITANQAISPDNLGLLAEEINPGSSRDALIVYDITQSVIDSQSKQLQVQSGMFGTETGIINLQ